jgi:hypothetical protein
MNRYGRHGTRAWLRRHLKRREKQQTSTSLTVAKPFIPNVILNITVPAGVERVIIIMVGNPDDFNDTNEQNKIFSLPPPIVDQDSKEIQAVKRGAGYRISNFIDQTKARYNNVSVFIPPDTLAQIERKALIDERDHYSRDTVITQANLDQTFTKEFTRLLQEYKETSPNLFLSQRQWDICETARKDKEHAPLDWARVGDYHQRDLAILNAVKYLGIRPETETNREQLKLVHDWANEYDHFYQGRRKGVVWDDDPADFRQ